MKRLVLNVTLDHPSDIERIIRVCATNGFLITARDAQEAWSQYSDNFAASWLMLPEDNEELVAIIRAQCLEE